MPSWPDASRDRHRERAAEHDAERDAADRGAAESTAEQSGWCAQADQRDDGRARTAATWGAFAMRWPCAAI
jgi:hypothetical protein